MTNVIVMAFVIKSQHNIIIRTEDRTFNNIASMYCRQQRSNNNNSNNQKNTTKEHHRRETNQEELKDKRKRSSVQRKSYED